MLQALNEVCGHEFYCHRGQLHPHHDRVHSSAMAARGQVIELARKAFYVCAQLNDST